MAFSFTFENRTIPETQPNLISVHYWGRGEKFLTKGNEMIWKFQ